MTMQAFALEDEREESVIERRDRERIENGKVENTEEIPLIPNLKHDVRRTITALEVWKEDPPGAGFKGKIPPHADLSMVSQLYGNGMYEFRAINADGKILRRSSGIQIAMVSQAPERPASQAATSDKEMQLLQWQAEQHSRESARTEAFGRMAVDSTREIARENTRMLTEQHTSSSNRDRDFFQSLMNQQQQFFAGIMQQAEQAHRLAAERAQNDFQRTIQLMTITNTRAQEANDPRNILAMAQQLLALTAGSAGPDDDEEDDNDAQSQGPWAEALTSGIAAVKDITELAKIKAVTDLRQPAQQSQKPAAALPNPQLQKRRTPRVPGVTREDLKTFLEVKRTLSAKGLDFNQTVRQLMPYLTGGSAVEPNEPEDSGSEDADASEEPDSGEAGPADMENA